MSQYQKPPVTIALKSSVIVYGSTLSIYKQSFHALCCKFNVRIHLNTCLNDSNVIPYVVSTTREGHIICDTYRCWYFPNALLICEQRNKQAIKCINTVCIVSIPSDEVISFRITLLNDEDTQETDFQANLRNELHALQSSQQLQILVVDIQTSVTIAELGAILHWLRTAIS